MFSDTVFQNQSFKKGKSTKFGQQQEIIFGNKGIEDIPGGVTEKYECSVNLMANSVRSAKFYKNCRMF